ncbi:glycosyltransferase [Halioglobus sp.]|nr:glycosyltransferase [Halioglobus sp.]
MVSRTQDQITNSWNETETVAVSVVCTTYNHELYIREALEGFLMQVTTFPFEIIIHDDASTDNTGNIIREYGSKYPAIIRPIFQSENQYSKGGFKPIAYAAQFAQGIYIAVCEGDDYWCDERKLQLQFDALEAAVAVDMCVHPAYRLKKDNRSKKPFWKVPPRLYSSLEVALSRTGFAPTSSYFIRRDVMKSLPAWFYRDAPVGDFFMEIFGSAAGGVLYMKQPMAVYRVKSVGSWTSEMSKNPEVHLPKLEAMIIALERLGIDFPSIKTALERRCAVPLLKISVVNLRLGKEAEFKENICKSWKARNFLSIKQVMLYFLRSRPALLRRIYVRYLGG